MSVKLSCSSPELAGTKPPFNHALLVPFSSFIRMAPKKKESRSQTPETCAEKIQRLENNFTGRGLLMVNRASLIHELEMAYAKYQRCFHDDDKKQALRWDGHIRALHVVLDMEINDG